MIVTWKFTQSSAVEDGGEPPGLPMKHTWLGCYQAHRSVNPSRKFVLEDFFECTHLVRNKLKANKLYFRQA